MHVLMDYELSIYIFMFNHLYESEYLHNITQKLTKSDHSLLMLAGYSQIFACNGRGVNMNFVAQYFAAENSYSFPP